ncbi:MAG: hypothetical protein ACFFG0_26030, partial [Candidatus Thorarchaeota archaeon]
MLISTFRDFITIIKTLAPNSIEYNQYLKKFKPSSWSKPKSKIYLRLLEIFGFISLNSSISITETGSELIKSVEKNKTIFIDTFFKKVTEYSPISDLIKDLKTYFLENPQTSIKKLVNKSRRIKKLGLVGHYFISLLLSSFYLYNELPREEEHFELLAKSFINTVIDKKGISFQKLVENTNYF